MGIEPAEPSASPTRYLETISLITNLNMLPTLILFIPSKDGPFHASRPPCFYQWLRCFLFELLYNSTPHRPPQAASVPL